MLQEHVSEYGVHWNFFFTLAVIAFATALVPLRGATAAIAAVMLTSGHQLVLSCAGFTTWLERDARDCSDVIDANREGLCSLPGYLALCYAGSASATLLQHRLPPAQPPSAARQHVSDQCKDVSAEQSAQGSACLLRLAAVASAAWAAVLVLDAVVQPVSRRFCNAAYVLWVMAMALTIMLAGAVAEVACSVATGTAGVAPSRIARGLSEQQLAVFLIANMLTGAVNMSIDTLNAGVGATAAVMIGYSLCWTLLPLGLQELLRKTKRQ